MTNDDRISYLAGEPDARIEESERAQLDRVRSALNDPAVWAEPAPDLEDRIVAAITAAAREEAPVAPAAPVVLLRPRWVRYAVSAVAAAAVVAVALAISLNRGGQPVQFAASLNGTRLAPSASGEVTLTKTTSGWRITLHAKGLPRRDGGEYYEAWLKNAQGQLVPIGTFNQGDDVTLWSGVSPANYPTLTVTRQVANGQQASSGQVVLAGPTHQKS
ncbi:MAG: anti-sigma factor [Actinomycetales bacterium]